MTNHPLQWFIDRIGKTVYRTSSTGKTAECFIESEAAARFYYSMQDNPYFNYRDNP